MEENKSTVRAVERALDILLCFASGTDLAMTEIAERVGLHKSTVHRMLATLEERGFVVRDRISDRYRLGMRIWELSAHWSNADDPAVMWLPEMERLRDQLGETISLYVRDGKERIRIQAVQSNQAIRRVAPVGARLPLYVGASSKVLITYADEAEREEIMKDDSWPLSIDLKAFREQMEEIRRSGYATSVEEREPGAAAVAAPIFNRSDRLIAVLSVSGPSSRLTPEKMREHAPLIIASARLMGMMGKS
ncbi:IclR family transcriptional regulator [Paenibacillus tarimensis]